MLLGIRSMLQWKPDVEEFTATLNTPRPFRLRLEVFPKGVDNAHIDVLLSSAFQDAARRLIRNIIAYDARINLWRERATPPDQKQLESFTSAYTGMMETGTGMARRQSRPEVIQLLQFATIKFLLLSLDQLIVEHREQLQKPLQGSSANATQKSAQLHDRLLILAREETSLKHRTTHKIFALIYKAEATSLRRARKGLLGRSWPVPKEMLFNPVLQLPSLWASEQLMKIHPPLGINEDDLFEFDRINRVVTEIFGEYLPEWASPPPAHRHAGENGVSELRQRSDQGGLDGFLQVELLLTRALNEAEFREGRTCWLDDVENVRMVASVQDVEWERRRDAEARESQRNRHSFALYLRELILHTFEKHDLVMPVLAAHRAPELYQELHGELPVRLIIQYLQGDISRRKMHKRLTGMRDVKDADNLLRQLEKERLELHKLDKQRRQQLTIEFLSSFVALRRNLKLAYQTYWILNQINLLEDERRIELSRSNNSLIEFNLSDERPDKQHTIRNHTILKADLRGSTTITTQLREKNLNPATHFSLNFFDPVTSLLEQFGASKVFVEGDAVILTIYEYEDEPNDWLAVARICGLARKILDVVDVNNARNQKYALPNLELGLGICFKPEAPAFLYDGDHQIMISPAINRADRLSGCTASLRKTSLESRKRGVEVVAPVDQGIMQKSTSDNLLRYNVNGIELDEEAFVKLKSELTLRKLKGQIPGLSENSLFYIGQFPDKRGVMHWLVVREAPIRLWIGNDVGTEEAGGRRFYEVITDPGAISYLKENANKMRQKYREDNLTQTGDSGDTALHAILDDTGMH